MLKNSDRNLSENQSKIVKCIFRGMSITQIAKVIGCSTSCVSYNINSLYEKYKAKTRSDFILSVFGQIVDRYKSLIKLKNAKISYLSNKNKQLQEILLKLLDHKNNSDTYEYWVSEAKKLL